MGAHTPAQRHASTETPKNKKSLKHRLVYVHARARRLGSLYILVPLSTMMVMARYHDCYNDMVSSPGMGALLKGLPSGLWCDQYRGYLARST